MSVSVRAAATPQATLEAMVTALERGDINALMRQVDQSSDQAREAAGALRTIYEVAIASERFRDAFIEKFGQDAFAEAAQGFQFDAEMSASTFRERLSDAQIDVDGDTAVVDMEGGDPLYLIKRGNEWLINPLGGDMGDRLAGPQAGLLIGLFENITQMMLYGERAVASTSSVQQFETRMQEIGQQLEAGELQELSLPAPDAGGGAGAAPRGGPVNQATAQLWSDFCHYTLIARLDLAAASGQALLDKVDNQQLLDIVEASRYNYRDILLKRQNSPDEDFREVAVKLLESIEEANISRSRDEERIARNIDFLSQGRRAYLVAVGRLKAAGQYAAPQMVATLADETQQRLHPYVMSALVEMGSDVVYPLSVSLENLEPVTMGQVARVLGQIGYPQALPYLKQLIEAEDTDPNAKTILESAYRQILDATASATDADASQLYLILGTAEYRTGTREQELVGYDTAEDVGVVWYYTNDAGLVPARVPSEIYPDVMAMRSARRALQLDSNLDPALSLYIGANLRRENRLPAGADDPTYGSQMRPPIYYAMLAGPQRLHDVLQRALEDSDPALALDAIDALQRTAGTDALANRGAARQPLITALSYPDRRVRFNAAMALANARPRQSFEGAARVVPVLAEAVRQSDQRYAVVVGKNQETANKTMAMLEERGYQVIGGQTLGELTQQLNLAPGIDLLVINAAVDEVLRTRQNAQANYKLATTPILALVDNAAQIQLRQLAEQDPLLSTAVVPAEDEALSNAIENAAGSYVGAAITAAEAEQFALDALESLRDIAQGSSGGVYEVTDAMQALIQALSDPRENVAAKASTVLALIDRPVAQQAIADAALKTSDALQIAMFESLADSATHFGNNLSQLQSNAILDLAIASEGDLAVAAGEAHGALTLPTANAVQLITAGK